MLVFITAATASVFIVDFRASFSVMLFLSCVSIFRTCFCKQLLCFCMFLQLTLCVLKSVVHQRALGWYPTRSSDDTMQKDGANRRIVRNPEKEKKCRLHRRTYNSWNLHFQKYALFSASRWLVPLNEVSIAMDLSRRVSYAKTTFFKTIENMFSQNEVRTSYSTSCVHVSPVDCISFYRASTMHDA